MTNYNINFLRVLEEDTWTKNPFEACDYLNYSVSYQITDIDSNIVIGTAMGMVTDMGHLVTAIHLVEEYQRKKLGKIIFDKIFSELNSHKNITGVIGTWQKDIEFNHLEEGMSLNLLIFNRCKDSGKNNIDSAKLTPTGKWAMSYGFKNVKIIIETPENVKVLFF